MIELTDTHCHIQSIGQATGGEPITAKMWLKLDTSVPDEVIARAKAAGVTRLIAVGCTLEDSLLALKLAEGQPNVWASAGIHPHEAKDYANNEQKLKDFSELASKPKVVAIGECGLDYYYNHSDPKDQHIILEFQLSLAELRNLPVIFHVREAFDDFWPLLDKHKNIRGVLHSFTDSSANLEKAIARGLMIGVNGIATFTKDFSQTEVYKNIPLKNLLLETDSPFLTPSPVRSTINEPKNLRLVGEYLAKLRGESLETIASQTTRNAHKLFSL